MSWLFSSHGEPSRGDLKNLGSLFFRMVTVPSALSKVSSFESTVTVWALSILTAAVPASAVGRIFEMVERDRAIRNWILAARKNTSIRSRASARCTGAICPNPLRHGLSPGRRLQVPAIAPGIPLPISRRLALLLRLNLARSPA